MNKSEVDETAARELVLWADNTRSLLSHKESIIANLKRKANKGIYDHEKAVKAWEYWMDAAARDYCREFQCRMAIFSKATRHEAARQVEQAEYAEYECNGWE